MTEESSNIVPLAVVERKGDDVLKEILFEVSKFSLVNAVSVVFRKQSLETFLISSQQVFV